MNFYEALFDMQAHRQVLLRTFCSGFGLAILVGFLVKYVWDFCFPGAIYPSVTDVRLVSFAITCVIATPVLYGMFYMSLKVSLKNKQLFQLANLDPLTGIFNRRALANEFLLRSRKARRTSATGTLLVIDVDKFKAINDDYGHETGDHVLIHLARLLSEFADSTSCVARLGGEEFAIVHYAEEGKHDAQEAARFAEQLRDRVETTPFEISTGAVSLTISIGYCDLNAETSLNTALRNADAALYSAKRTGRNRVVKYDSRAPALVPESEDLLQPVVSILSSQAASSN